MSRRNRDQEPNMSFFNSVANLVMATIPLAAVIAVCLTTGGGGLGVA
jgi:hypothetical protein